MAALAPTHPAVLMDELLEEFLIRLPPEDPVVLARAAFVSRQWHRVITAPVFRRRFCEFHRSAPLLGYILNLHGSIRFVPTSSFRPLHAVRRDVWVIHSGHGRVLLRRYGAYEDVNLYAWNPITDEQRDLPVVPCPLRTCSWDFCDAAVACAVGDGCDHLHCHFKVVFVGRSQQGTFSCFYSSEADSWSHPIFASGEGYCCFMQCLVGSALYFRCGLSHKILKYDLLTHQMCTIGVQGGGVLIATEDGRVGVAKIWNSNLRLWSLRDHGGWEESRAIALHTLLPDDALCEIQALGNRPFVASFAEIGGTRVIFLSTRLGYFTIDLSSGRSKKVGERLGAGRDIVPYVSFCTPASGAVSTDEGPGAGVAVTTYKVAVADVAVSTNEGPGNGVVVSTDEGPGAGVCQVHKKLKL